MEGIGGKQQILQYYRQKTKRDRDGVVKEFGAVARLKDSRRASYRVEAPQVSPFSARGPIYSNTVTSVIADVLKPDVMAPGSQIWGAWSPNGIDTNGYNGKIFVQEQRLESLGLPQLKCTKLKQEDFINNDQFQFYMDLEGNKKTFRRLYMYLSWDSRRNKAILNKEGASSKFKKGIQ